MGLNLKDYEYELPNTITGSVPYGTQTWSASDYFQSEALIVPYGRTYKIEMIRVVNGINQSGSNLSVGLSRSLEPNVWRDGSGYSNLSGYITYPEIQEAPTNSLSKQVVFNNQSYDMGFPHEQDNGYPYTGRTQFLLWSWRADSSSFSEWDYTTGMRVLSKEDGPLWMNSGDALHMWQNSNPSTTNGQKGQNFKATYIISYIEYF
tara:strand:+ start:1634 stop:2248 length:615 start_codon:yes stop_codon:yes gene_type:complete